MVSFPFSIAPKIVHCSPQFLSALVDSYRRTLFWG